MGGTAERRSLRNARPHTTARPEYPRPPLSDHGGSTQTHVPLPGSPAVNAGPSSLAASDLPGLFNTGDHLPLGVQDPSWQIVWARPDFGHRSQLLMFPDLGGCQSRQSLDRPERQRQRSGGEYVYRTTFDLTGFDPTTAMISGIWSADDRGIDILINGTSTSRRSLPST